MNKTIKKLVACYGSQDKAADVIGVSQSAIGKWLHELNRISPEKAIMIETKTGGKFSRYDLRPDIFGPRPATGTKS